MLQQNYECVSQITKLKKINQLLIGYEHPSPLIIFLLSALVNLEDQLSTGRGQYRLQHDRKQTSPMAHVVNSSPFDRRGLTQGRAIEAAGLGFQDKPGVKKSASYIFKFSSQLPTKHISSLICTQSPHSKAAFVHQTSHLTGLTQLLHWAVGTGEAGSTGIGDGTQFTLSNCQPSCCRFISFYEAVTVNSAVIHLMGFLVLLATVQLWTLLHLNPRLQVIGRTLTKAWDEAAGFLLVIVILLTGYAMAVSLIQSLSWGLWSWSHFASLRQDHYMENHQFKLAPSFGEKGLE